MKLSPIEVLGLVFWVLVPIGMWLTIEGQTTEYVLFWFYVASIIVSIIDIFTHNGWVTLSAFVLWLLYFFFGLTINEPAKYRFLAEKILQLEQAYPGNGYVFCGIAVISAIILFVSLGEEVLVERRTKK